MKNRIIIVEKELGVFLGTYTGIAIFSKNDTLESTKAYGFDTKDAAETFIHKHLPKIKDDVEYFEVATNIQDTYVDVIDIIKAGYPEYTAELFNNLPTNETIH